MPSLRLLTLGIGSLLGLASTEKLSLLFWQTSLSFILVGWLVYRSIIKLSAVALFPFVVLFCHNLIKLPSFISVLVLFVLYYSYSIILYSYYNIYSGYSYCGHAVYSACNASTRTCLYWDGSTYAQTSLKCISFKPAPTFLPQTHEPQYSRRDQSPTTQKCAPQIKTLMFDVLWNNKLK